MTRPGTPPPAQLSPFRRRLAAGPARHVDQPAPVPVGRGRHRRLPVGKHSGTLQPKHGAPSVAHRISSAALAGTCRRPVPITPPPPPPPPLQFPGKRYRKLLSLCEDYEALSGFQVVTCHYDDWVRVGPGEVKQHVAPFEALNVVPRSLFPEFNDPDATSGALLGLPWAELRARGRAAGAEVAVALLEASSFVLPAMLGLMIGKAK